MSKGTFSDDIAGGVLTFMDSHIPFNSCLIAKFSF